MKSQAESLINLIQKKNGYEEKPGNIFAFTSGKGGTGKTFVSLNLAFYLSQKNYNVLFVDFDSNLANADVLLNRTPDGTIVEFFKGKKLFNKIITRVNKNFSCIFGDSGLVDFPKLSDNLINQFLLSLQAQSPNFDFIFIDTGAGINKELIGLINQIENIVLVINPEPTTIVDAYAVLKMTANSTSRKFIIVNSVFHPEEAENAFTNLRKASLHFLKMEILKLGSVNFDIQIRQSIYEQKLFVNYFQNSFVHKQFEDISAKLIEQNQLANINHSF